MSQQPPPGCDNLCLIKWFQDNQGNAFDLQQIAHQGEEMHKEFLLGSSLPSSLIAALPDLIAEERQIHSLIRKHRAHWRKALGYRGQGLPPSEAADY